MSSFLNKLGLATALSASIFSTANAANTTIELKSIDQGIYDGVTASHNPLNPGVGIQQDAVYSSRNFFVFDFSGLKMANLISAELFAKNSWNSSTENQIEYSIFDITTNVADLRNGGNGQYSIYDDIGSGISYASIQINNPARYDNFEVSFNQAGVNAAKAATGLFAIGGSLTSQTSGIAWMFADNGNVNAPLSYGLRLTFSDSVTAVPEPDNFALLIAGIGILSLVARRSARK
jgi:hypothetical protein